MHLAVSSADSHRSIDNLVDVKHPAAEDFNCTRKRTMLGNWGALHSRTPDALAFSEGGPECSNRRAGPFIICQQWYVIISPHISRIDILFPQL